MKITNLKVSACAIAIASALTITTPAFANDSFNGSVRGEITSSNNAALAEATITLTHKDKGITRSIKSNADGSYSLSKLPVGEYTMIISKPGFQNIEQALTVKLGNAVVYNGVMATDSEDFERISVTGQRFAKVDLRSSTGGIIVTSDELRTMPVESGFESIALMSPGVTANSSFGAASIGGSSSAENAYYLNGINITSPKTGIGSISLPWEAISQTEVKTGGIDPKFGGALGGVVNAVSKSGGNDFEFGVEARIDPDALSSKHDNLYTNTGELFANSEQDESTFTRYSVWGSGALIEDKVFFYALYQPQKNDYEAAQTTTIDIGESTSDRHFAKLDWFINDNNSLEFTTIGYTSKGKGVSYENDAQNQVVGDMTGTYRSRTGGDIMGLKYSGVLTDDISVEMVAGRTRDKNYNSATSSDPLVWSKLSGSWVKLSQETASSVTESEFVRDQFRADINWTLDDHEIKFGVDYVKIDVDYQSRPNGVEGREGWWNINYATAGHASGLPQGEIYIDQRVRTDFTDSEVASTAFYLNDTWNVTDQLVLNMGVRVSSVYNTITSSELNPEQNGLRYVDVKNQIAPRLQAIYDLDGSGESKIYATYGRYFQPVSANMNITQGGARRDVHYYYTAGTLDANGEATLLPDGSPSTGDLVHTEVVQKGLTDPNLIASANLKSMYSDEFTLGYQTELLDGDMVVGVRGIYRDLKRSIEDTDYGPVINKYFAENNINADASWTYVLANPGSDLDISYDFDGDGTVDRVFIPGSELGLPKPKRKYTALETTVSGNVGEQIKYNFSYTWSHSWGNTEGLVRTDNGQADPGWTTSYDYAELMDHGYGNLPNDRRHAFKLNGTYDVTENLTLGLVSRVTSGAPINKFAVHPEGVDSCAPGSAWEACNGTGYGHVAFYDADGNPSPRGSAGRTDWLYEVDFSAGYYLPLGDNNLYLKATVYNLFNADTQISVNQTHGQDGANGVEVNPNWGMTTGRLGARYVSLTARYTF